jgi:hypothetical protein
MIDNIRKRVEDGDYALTIHGFERCVERNISPDEIRYVILSGEIIEDYPKDKYGPSCLIYGSTKRGGYYMSSAPSILFGSLLPMLQL